MKLLVQPDDGATPLVKAIQGACTSVDILIFRFDRRDIERALLNAVGRGVRVRALIAYTNRGGEKNLRALGRLQITFQLPEPACGLWR